MTFFLITIIAARFMWLCGLTVNNKIGWLTAQLILTCGQFYFAYINAIRWIYLKISIFLTIGFIWCMWYWSNQSFYQRVIQVKGYQLIFMTCFFVILLWVKINLYTLANFLYFTGLTTAAFFGNNGILFKSFNFRRESLDLFFSIWAVVTNIMWLFYFRERRKRCYLTNHMQN